MTKLNMKDVLGWRHLKVYGYAPGDYTGNCIQCSATWDDQDKRSFRCKRCAEEMYAADCAKDSCSAPNSDNKKGETLWH